MAYTVGTSWFRAAFPNPNDSETHFAKKKNSHDPQLRNFIICKPSSRPVLSLSEQKIYIIVILYLYYIHKLKWIRKQFQKTCPLCVLFDPDDKYTKLTISKIFKIFISSQLFFLKFNGSYTNFSICDTKYEKSKKT